MTAAAGTQFRLADPSGDSASPRWRRLHATENLILTLVLMSMAILPLLEVLLRKTLHTGIMGVTSIVQHLCLAVGMMGGAMAARDNRLLALFTVRESVLPPRFRSAVHLFTGTISTLVTLLLAFAGFQFVQAERAGGGTAFYGIPQWILEMALPVGFAAIAFRVLMHLPGNKGMRALSAVLSAALVFAISQIPGSPTTIVIGMVLLASATVLGAPAFVSLGGTALLLFWWVDQPIASISVSHYSLVTNPALPSLPLFTLAGFLLAESGAPRRLVRVFYALFGSLPGGASIVTVLACAFFTSFTGASGATILALGGLLMPILIDSGYSEKDALGLVTGAGALGILLPPCLPLILYAIVAQIPIQQMFLAGVAPSLLLMACTAGWGVWRARRVGVQPRPFVWGEAAKALWVAKWELLTPLVALVGMFGGFATPVEASAMTALYVFLVEVFIHRELKPFTDVPRVATECGLLIGGVLLVLGVALGLTNYMVDAEVPAKAVSWTTAVVHSPLLFLLLLNLFLTLVGCLMDIYSAIVVQVPLLAPLGAVFGIPPVHLGIVFLANMEHGYLTPPVGLNLLFASTRFRKPVPEVLRAVLPIIILLTVVVLLITYVPWLTTALPNWLGK
ncbi:MAG TPA: TRAP transporter large permease subunit [Candidatus Angelobacter sp.]|nr:TRAP transporter large permease subunit [Candidatus Angelobacter sp.]